MKYCLIIDDTNQKDEISQLEKMARESGFPITCYYFNPTSKECLREETKVGGDKEYVMDIDLILQELQKIPLQQIDLIATDYKLSDKSITGLDLVKLLKENNWKGKTPYIIYSGESDEIKEKLQLQIKDIIDDKKELNKFIEGYFKTNPDKIFARKKSKDGVETPYTTKIYEFLKKNKTSLNVKLHQRLKQNPDYTFNNIFPGFNGKKLGELSDLVIKNSAESDTFENEFLDRSIAHFIYLEE